MPIPYEYFGNRSAGCLKGEEVLSTLVRVTRQSVKELKFRIMDLTVLFDTRELYLATSRARRPVRERSAHYFVTSA